MERNMEITQQLVKNLFDYRDGVLYWKIQPSNCVQVGDKAGALTGKGYLQTGINGKNYKNHRVIFLMHYGFLPAEIDHIDGNRTNNNIENLREATRSENNCNARTRADNTSGVIGVCWHKRDKIWQVRISVYGKEKYFGRYDNLEQAKLVAIELRSKYHGEFARHD